MFRFWRKRTADEAPPPPDTAPRHVRRWVESLPRFVREKVARLCGTEQDELWEYAAQWPVDERIDRLWARIDWQARTATWRDVSDFMDRSAPYPSCHGAFYDSMPEFKAGAWAGLAESQARIAHFRATVAALVEGNPEVMQQLVTVVYHLGEGRFTDDDYQYQEFQETFPEVAPLVAAVRAKDAAAHDHLYAQLAARNKEQA
jgi:hypothetical protein